LSRYDLLVDAPGGRLLLREIGPEVSWPGVGLSPPIHLRIYHGVVIGLDAEVDGTSYLATLDLGTPGMLVNEPARAALGLDAEDTATLRLGTSTMTNVPVRVSDHPVLARFDPDGRGFVLVGSAVANGCRVSLSWVHQEMRTCVR
jgi:hypothetical protein